MNMAIPILAFLVPFVLCIRQYIGGYLVMCRGYNEDDVNFTELVWQDDKDLNFFDKQDYPEFQIWITAQVFRLCGRCRNGQV